MLHRHVLYSISQFGTVGCTACIMHDSNNRSIMITKEICATAVNTNQTQNRLSSCAPLCLVVFTRLYSGQVHVMVNQCGKFSKYSYREAINSDFQAGKCTLTKYICGNMLGSCMDYVAICGAVYQNLSFVQSFCSKRAGKCPQMWETTGIVQGSCGYGIKFVNSFAGNCRHHTVLSKFIMGISKFFAGNCGHRKISKFFVGNCRYCGSYMLVKV